MTPQRKQFLIACVLPALIVLGGGLLTFRTIVSVPDQDVMEYYRNSAHVLHGRMPYRDFTFEYPILALLPMLVPHLLTLGHAGAFPAYASGFLAMNVLIAGVLGATLARVGRESALDVVKGYAIMLGCTAVVAPWRFDLLLAWITALALDASMRRRHGLAGALLAVGVAAKLYPIVLVPAFLRAARRPHAGRLLAGFGSTLAVLMAITGAAAGFKNSLSFLTYHAHRGIQIESVAAGIAFLAHGLGLTSLGFVYNFGAYHLAFAGSHAVLRLLTVLLAGVYAAALYSTAKRPHIDTGPGLARVCALLLLAFIVTNKVFSIQYVLWLLPFAALFAESVALYRISLAVFVLTTVDALCYSGLLHFDPTSIAVLNLRNAATIALFVALLRPPRRPTSPEREPFDPAFAYNSRT